MKNSFFYSESGQSASMLFNKLFETTCIYLNYERIIISHRFREGFVCFDFGKIK